MKIQECKNRKDMRQAWDRFSTSIGKVLSKSVSNCKSAVLTLRDIVLRSMPTFFSSFVLLGIVRGPEPGDMGDGEIPTRYVVRATQSMWCCEKFTGKIRYRHRNWILTNNPRTLLDMWIDR